MKKQKPNSEYSGMHKGANAQIFRNARKLRENMTASETLLWERIKDRQLGCKFRKQHPIGNYIADFYCHEHKLIIELDGGYHNKNEQQFFDEKRTKDLEGVGLTVIRFLNKEVEQKMDRVVEEIIEVLERLK